MAAVVAHVVAEEELRTGFGDDGRLGARDRGAAFSFTFLTVGAASSVGNSVREDAAA